MSELYTAPKLSSSGAFRGVLMAAFLLVAGHIAATQYLAYWFAYDPQLGASFHGLYAPWMVWKWERMWWHVPEPDIRQAFRIAIYIMIVSVIASVGAVPPSRRKLLTPGTEKIHGGAHFATPEEVHSSRLLGHTHGVYVGAWTERKGFRKVTHYLMHDGPEHIIGIAPNRSGKGVGLVIPTLLAWQESAVIFDLKGENWTATAGYRETLGPVFRLDLTDETASRWNPLEEIRVFSAKDTDDAQNIAEILCQDGINKSQPHFDASAAHLVTGLILHAVYFIPRELGRAACLGDIWMMLADPDKPFDARLQEMLTYKHLGTQTHPAVAQIARDMLDRLRMSQEEFGGDVATLKTKMKALLSTTLAKQTSVSDFHVDDLVNHRNPVSVYIVVPPPDLERLRPMVRIFLTLFVDKLTANLEAAKQYKHRVLMMIDEFPTLNRLKVFAKGIGFIAGYGLKVYVIAQDYAQIVDAYGAQEGITSQCDVRVVMPPNKIETAELISRWAGDTTVVHEHVSQSRSGVFGRKNVSVSMQHTRRRLITPEELMNSLKRPKRVGEGKDEKIKAPGEMLVFAGGTSPIIAKQILFWQDAVFLERSQLRPPDRMMAIAFGEIDLQQEPPDLVLPKADKETEITEGKKEKESDAEILEELIGAGSADDSDSWPA